MYTHMYPEVKLSLLSIDLVEWFLTDKIASMPWAQLHGVSDFKIKILTTNIPEIDIKDVPCKISVSNSSSIFIVIQILIMFYENKMQTSTWKKTNLFLLKKNYYYSNNSSYFKKLKQTSHE